MAKVKAKGLYSQSEEDEHDKQLFSDCLAFRTNSFSIS